MLLTSKRYWCRLVANSLCVVIFISVVITTPLLSHCQFRSDGFSRYQNFKKENCFKITISIQAFANSPKIFMICTHHFHIEHRHRQKYCICWDQRKYWKTKDTYQHLENSRNNSIYNIMICLSRIWSVKVDSTSSSLVFLHRVIVAYSFHTLYNVLWFWIAS